MLALSANNTETISLKAQVTEKKFSSQKDEFHSWIFNILILQTMNWCDSEYDKNR